MAGPIKPPRSKHREERIAAGAETLFQIIGANRAHAVSVVLEQLFEPDVGGQLLRLRGLGGPTGTVTLETAQAAAQVAVNQVLMPKEEDIRAQLTAEQQAEAEGAVS